MDGGAAAYPGVMGSFLVRGFRQLFFFFPTHSFFPPFISALRLPVPFLLSFHLSPCELYRGPTLVQYYGEINSVSEFLKAAGPCMALPDGRAWTCSLLFCSRSWFCGKREPSAPCASPSPMSPLRCTLQVRSPCFGPVHRCQQSVPFFRWPQVPTRNGICSFPFCPS